MAAGLSGCVAREAGGEDEDECETGSLGCECYGNKSCDEGLSCLSKICVDPTDTGDDDDADDDDEGDDDEGDDDEGDDDEGDDDEGDDDEGDDDDDTGDDDADDDDTDDEGDDDADDDDTGDDDATADDDADDDDTGDDDVTADDDTGDDDVTADDDTGDDDATADDDSSLPSTLIDDFADCDENIARVDGRDGFWYNFADADVGYNPDPAEDEPLVSAVPATFDDTSCGAWMTGGCDAGAVDCTFAGFGFTFLESEEPYDITGYTGFRFGYEGDEMYVVVHSTSGVFGGYVTPSSGARATREIRFSSLVASPGHGTDEYAVFNPAGVIKIEFTTTALLDNAGFGQAVYDVEFY